MRKREHEQYGRRVDEMVKREADMLAGSLPPKLTEGASEPDLRILRAAIETRVVREHLITALFEIDQSEGRSNDDVKDPPEKI